MRKEARYNLIFFILLLAICLPGITMLVRKKLSQPPGHQMGFSSPIRLEIPYVDPLPVGSENRLIYPPRLREWVRSLSPDAPADWARISQRRSFEVIAWRDTADGMQISLLLWDPRVDPDQLQFEVGPVRGRIERLMPVKLPAAVMSELRQLGYLDPPAEVPRVEVLFDRPAPANADLVLSGVRGPVPFEDYRSR